MRELLEENLANVYRFALRLTGNRHAAEDLAQEALLRAWRGRAQLQNRDRVRVWLLRITANVWRDGLRKQRPEPKQSPLDDEQPAPADSPHRCIEMREQAQRALRALDSLPPRQREALYLCACEGLSPREIAEVVGSNRDAVKANLHLARKRMRELLKDALQD